MLVTDYFLIKKRKCFNKSAYAFRYINWCKYSRIKICSWNCWFYFKNANIFERFHRRWNQWIAFGMNWNQRFHELSLTAHELHFVHYKGNSNHVAIATIHGYNPIHDNDSCQFIKNEWHLTYTLSSSF